MTAYEKDLIELPAHLFRASWQHDQMNECIKGLSDTEAALIMDYSENYGCTFQNETQSAFFDRNQVTIHPMMLYYKDPDLFQEYS